MPNAEYRMPNDAGSSSRAPRKAVWGERVRLIAMLTGALLAAAALTSCGDNVTNGSGNSYLVMTTLSGTAGTPVSSDVRNDATGGAAPDLGTAAFTLRMKDTLTAPGPNNAITLTQYHVEYVRADGHNVPGVDVPFAFDGGVNVTIQGSGSAGFTLVRVQAKEEAPLKALAFSGGRETITAIAKVTFYGHDQTGRDVSVSGNIEVTFSDWAG